jgi:hypothetical protein
MIGGWDGVALFFGGSLPLRNKVNKSIPNTFAGHLAVGPQKAWLYEWITPRDPVRAFASRYLWYLSNPGTKPF